MQILYKLRWAEQNNFNKDKVMLKDKDNVIAPSKDHFSWDQIRLKLPKLYALVFSFHEKT